MTLIKYLRTRHLQGSRKTGDDFELTDEPFENLVGKYVVYEEKLDGSNTGVSFSNNGDLLLQSRGHYLRGGPREKQFGIFKVWANVYKNDLYDMLGERYIMYGEWMQAKHTVYYDNLPHYFHEFDIFDKEKGIFLSTAARQKLLEGLDYVAVPILYAGCAVSLDHLKGFIKKSLYKSDNWKNSLFDAAQEAGIDKETVMRQTDMSDLSEGIYIKVETETETVDRYKFVRADFTNKIIESNKEDGHWTNRPIIQNKLSDGAKILGG